MYTLSTNGTSLHIYKTGRHLVKSKSHAGVHSRFGCTDEIFGTEKSVLFMEVSSIQGRPYSGVPLYIISYGKEALVKRSVCSTYLYVHVTQVEYIVDKYVNVYTESDLYDTDDKQPEPAGAVHVEEHGPPL